MKLARGNRMIKHMAVSGVFIGLLVASLVYCISPAEFESIRSTLCSHVSTAPHKPLADTLNRGATAIEEARKPSAAPGVKPAVARKMTPDPFRPFGSRYSAGPNEILVWLKGPQAIEVLLSIAALAVAARYARRRHIQFATQEKMALTLSKAVRQM